LPAGPATATATRKTHANSIALDNSLAWDIGLAPFLVAISFVLGVAQLL
jgi:hypothetical protein